MANFIMKRFMALPSPTLADRLDGISRWLTAQRSQPAPLPDSRSDLHSQIRSAVAAQGAERTQLMARLAATFLEAADEGDDELVTDFISAGFPLDVTEPGTGQTALHIVAACGARRAVMMLIQSRRVDFLIRDDEGRLASEMAGVFGDDPAMARLLRIKERKQAQAQGVALTRRPRQERS